MSDKGYWLLLSCVIGIIPALTDDKADKWIGRTFMWVMIAFAFLGVHQP